MAIGMVDTQDGFDKKKSDTSACVVVPMAIGMVGTKDGFDKKNKVTHLPGWWSRWLSGW